MSLVLDGKQIAAKLRGELEARIEALRAKGVTPGLAVVLVGEDPASQIYVRNKEKTCKELGMNSWVYRLPDTTTQAELMECIARLNADPSVHGILVQSPVSEPLDEGAVLKAVHPDKDVDGFHPVNAGRLSQGERGFVPCTPMGVMRMLEETGVALSGKHAVVIGRSNIVGKPMALLLLQKHCTVTICHSRTQDLPAIARQADILVAAVGRPGFVTRDMVKEGAIVIDVGINRTPGSKKVRGDVDYEAVAPLASWITPVPGGVGPMTIMMLMQNTVEAAENAL